MYILSTSLQGNVTMDMFVNMTVDFHWTYNVLAYTDGVRDDSIIVVSV